MENDYNLIKSNNYSPSADVDWYVNVDRYVKAPEPLDIRTFNELEKLVEEFQ